VCLAAALANKVASPSAMLDWSRFRIFSMPANEQPRYGLLPRQLTNGSCSGGRDFVI
jgi:hypothetical protein